MKTASLAIVLSLAALPAFAQSPKDEIDAANARFEQGFEKGDAAALAQMYTETATVLPPDSDLVTGRGAIADFWQGALKAGLKNLRLRAFQVEALGPDAAKEIGHFSIDVPNPQNRTMTVQGKYVVVWRKIGTDWKLDADIWNMNAPAKNGTQ